MPLKITVAFEPQENLVLFTIDAANLSTPRSAPHLLCMSFSHLEPEEYEAMDALGQRGQATVACNLAEWRHRASCIARSFEVGHLWDMAPEDCAIDWHDEQGNQHASPKTIAGPADIVQALGSTEIREFLRVADPCYQWKESNDAHVLVQPGQWSFEMTMRDDQKHGMSNGHRPARLVAYNADVGPLDMQALLTTSKPLARCSVDSALAGFFFDVPVPANGPAKDAWYDSVTDGVLRQEDNLAPPAYFGPERNAVVASTFYGDGSYPIFAQYNEQGQAIAMAVVTDRHDPLLLQNPHLQERMDYEDEIDTDIEP